MRISRIQIAIIVTLLALTASLAWIKFGDDGGVTGEAVDIYSMVSVGGPFTLVDQNANTVTDADFRGHFMLVLFGYTSCPDVCPTELTIISEALDILGKDGDKVVPIFISVDPQRDTPEILKDYVPNFHPRLVGLTGTPEQVASAAKAYNVYYTKPKDEAKDSGDYFVGHSTLTFLMGTDGQYLTSFSGGTPPRNMAGEIKQLMNVGKTLGTRKQRPVATALKKANPS